MSNFIKYLADKNSKRGNFSAKDLSDLSDLITKNIDLLTCSPSGQLLITDGVNSLTLGFATYKTLDRSFKNLSSQALKILENKMKNPGYNQVSYDLDHKTKLIALLKQIGEFEEEFGQTMANKKYREDLTNILLREKFPTLKCQDKKIDFICPELDIHSGETKTAKVILKQDQTFTNCKFEFDKQNDPGRRANTLKSDGFIFAGFNGLDPSDSSILFYCLVNKPEEVIKIVDLLRKKQELFLEKKQLAEDQDKQISRDTIQVELLDLVNSGFKIHDPNHNLITLTVAGQEE